jgi:Putative prokaryotic signal transducing protein
MAQDPEEELGPVEGSIDTSSELDMIPLYRSPSAGSEIEADVIRGILDSHGIPTLMSRAMGYPQLGFQVHVHRRDFQEANRVIEEAKAAGPGAALEAELASEEDR